MGIKLSNNAFATLAASINSSATSITLTTGQGARFPTLSAGDYFYATLIDTSNNLEIVKCTARSTDVLTVVRGQESTTARAYSTGDRIEIRITAATFVDATAITPAAVSDQNNTSTGYFDLPSGTTAQRPGTPAAGMIRYNSTTGSSEVYQNNAWIPFGVIAYPINALVVAGGGGGGGAQVPSNFEGGGGGGAGGYLTTSLFATGQTVYTVTVGAGGAGGGVSRSANGSNSVFSAITTIGGGAGAGRFSTPSDYAATSGGSGGGGQNYATFQAGASGTTGQGNAGGNASSVAAVNGGNGGGGGSGGVGGNSSGTTGGNGGAGTSNSITGSAVIYAGGGGGGGGTGGTGQGGGGNGSSGGGVNGGNGTANRGGGGGGGVANTQVTLGGNGGSGVVILSLPTAFYSGITTGSPTVTTNGNDTILTFTSSGSYTA